MEYLAFSEEVKKLNKQANDDNYYNEKIGQDFIMQYWLCYCAFNRLERKEFDEMYQSHR